MTAEPPDFALERWFASLPRPARCDLTGSGAPPLSLADLLAVASPVEREAALGVTLGYGPAEGSVALRSAIARRAGARPEDVLVTCGAIEALRLVVDSLLGPGDEVIVQDPMYPAVAGMARSRGARVVSWRLHADRGFRGTVDDLARLLSSRTRLVAIAQPNGPTGSVLDAGELAALGALLAERAIWLLSDEVYRDLRPRPGVAVPTAGDASDRAIVVGDVAKPFGLGGLRIGWLISPSVELRRRVQSRRDYSTLSVPTLSDALAGVALAHAAELLERPLRQARANLGTLSALAARDHVMSFVPPRAGVTAFLRVAGASRVQRQLQEEGVLVVPGALFGHPDHLRVALAVQPRHFAHGLARLARAARSAA